MRSDFGYLDEQVPGIFCDATYATADNFTGQPVDGYEAKRVVGSLALCRALRAASAEAAGLGYGLLVWDAYRPQRAVDHFLRWTQEPEDGSTKAGYYPNIKKADMVALGYVAANSGHSRGSSVDLTLVQLASGEPVSMGGGHDLMDEISHHGATGLSSAETANRLMLRSIMECSRFVAYRQEWWHYSLADEPFPETYFDFPVA